MAISSYTTGTVAVANGATQIIGTETIWSGVNARAGDDIVVAGHTVIIGDVVDETHLQIDPWPYSDVAAGAPYKIVQRSPERFSGAQVTTDMLKLLGILNGMGTIYAVNGATPDPSIGDEGQYALKTNSGVWKLWKKSGGAWVDQGSPVGTNYRGAWDAGATYVSNDTVGRLGSSYISKGANTNKPPESNLSFWDVLAQRGDSGPEGQQGAPGPAATVTVNSTTTMPAGSPAKVSNIGTTTAASLVFEIPQGQQGIQGIQGLQGQGIDPDASGTFAQRSTYDGAVQGFLYLQTDVSPARMWFKASNTSGDWAGPTYIGGNFPVGDMGHITDSIVQTYDFGSVV